MYGKANWLGHTGKLQSLKGIEWVRTHNQWSSAIFPVGAWHCNVIRTSECQITIVSHL